MKIALVAAPYPLEEAPSPPLGLCYVAAACESTGADVTILDYIVRKYTPEKLARELDSFRPDVVGTSSVTMNFFAAADILRTAKRYNPALITMMGGPHVSFDVENTLRQYPEIDLIVIGEGEETLQELIPVIKDRNAWKDVKGIAFHEDDRIVFTGERELIQDLDTLPLPARHLLPMSRYQALGYPVSIITSRGCPNKCIFCQGRRMVGYKVRHRSHELVVDEIEDVLSYGWNRINVADDIFTANKKRVVSFCDELKKRNLSFTWSAFARVNTVDLEMLRCMREAGCDAVSFGIESGNVEMLKRIRKGITLDQARKAVQYCKEVGMLAHASFMVGLPGESHETMNDSRTFAEELDILYGYHMLAPLPGTTVRDEVEKYDLEILTNDWNLYDANRAIVRTSHLTPEEMNTFVDAYAETHRVKWREAEERYRNDNCTPEEYLTIEGFYKTQLIFHLLSEDVVEELDPIPLSNGDPVRELSARIAELATNIDRGVIDRSLAHLVTAGYLKHSDEAGAAHWYWTYNNRSDRSPVPYS